ncbi:MAG: hypothetical protein IAE93_04620 [Ignavibacteria bacterium]|nr:hypothetical protein [Ignavibacteria bacterium]
MPKKILIIDEEKWFFSPIFDRLKYDKLDYEYCETGIKGLTRFKNNIDNYSIIILDIKLTLGEQLIEVIRDYLYPGIYVLEELRKIDKKIPIICYTVINNEETREKIGRMNANYIAKQGNSSDSLFKEINKLLK